MVTERRRILDVLNRQTPDRVPFMLDMSHYYYHKYNKEWNILNGYVEPEHDLIAFNKQFGAGFYVPNQMLLFSSKHTSGVEPKVEVIDVNGCPEIHWRYETPIGAIERVRVWEPSSYSWAIKRWGVTTEQDLKVLGYVMEHRAFTPLIENYIKWDGAVGDDGFIYLLPGYSAMGHILHYWMGVEQTVYACEDWNATMHEVVDQINDSCLKIVGMLADYPAPAAVMGDNFSADIQPPSFFNEWSAPFYRKAIDIFHKKGIKVALHVDGKLRGAIDMVKNCGADVVDAVTPPPMGDLTPAQCREEAGPALILSGGVSPDLFLPDAPAEAFKRAVIDWLEIRKESPALILAAGDQVPPGAEEDKLYMMHELVEKYGRY